MHRPCCWLQVTQLKPATSVYAVGPKRTMLNKSVYEYRPMLDKARATIVTAAYEPPSLTGQPFESGPWGRVVRAAEVLLTRTAALETVLSTDEHVLGDVSLAKYYKVDIVPTLRFVTAKLAAACAALAADVRAGAPKQLHTLNADNTWSECKAEIAGIMAAALAHYWWRIRHSADSVKVPNVQRTRSVMFTWTLVNGIVDGMEELQAAVAAIAPARSAARRGRAPFASAPQHQVWWWMLLQIAVGLPLLSNLVRSIRRGGREVLLGGKQGRHDLAQSRVFQAGGKSGLD